MPAISRIDDRRVRAELVALDRDDRPVVVVAAEEKRPTSPIIEAETLLLLRWIKPYIPFAILAYADETTIFRKDRDRTLTPVAKVSTREMYRHYRDGRPERDSPLYKITTIVTRDRFFKTAIVGTIDTWLRDFMWNLRETEPFESELIKSIGLADRLKGGRSRGGVRIGYLPIPRDELPPELRDWEERWDGDHPVEPAPIPPVDHP